MVIIQWIIHILQEVGLPLQHLQVWLIAYILNCDCNNIQWAQIISVAFHNAHGTNWSIRSNHIPTHDFPSQKDFAVNSTLTGWRTLSCSRLPDWGCFYLSIYCWCWAKYQDWWCPGMWEYKLGSCCCPTSLVSSRDIYIWCFDLWFGSQQTSQTHTHTVATETTANCL